MKIALCKSHFFGPVSGADEILVTYAIKLHQAGHDVRVVLLYKPPENDRYYERLRSAGVDVPFVIKRSVAFTILRSIRGLISSFLLLFLLIPNSERRLRKIWQSLMDLISRAHYRHCRSYFANSHYDLLHVFTPDTGAALMIRAGNEAGIPVLYHEMGTPHHLPALDQYYRRLEKVLPLCTEVAALSPLLAEQWSARFPFLRSVSVLPLITEDCDVLALPALLPLSDKQETIFGYAARIEVGKGPFVLADAVAQLRKTRNDMLVRYRSSHADGKSSCPRAGYRSFLGVCWLLSRHRRVQRFYAYPGRFCVAFVCGGHVEERYRSHGPRHSDHYDNCGRSS